MQNLRVGMSVTLELDEVGRLPCVVTSVEGSTSTLVQTQPPDRSIAERLSSGGRGYVVFADADAVIGLRGAAIVTAQSDPLIEFVVTDGVIGTPA